jgi:hypothetical protein
MRQIVLGFAAISLVILTASQAPAQVRFSIGTGGVAVGKAPPGYYPNGYGYGPNRYGRPYYGSTIVIGRTDSRPETRYVERTPQTYTGPGVTIRNPAEPGARLSYTIDARHAQDIAPGAAQQLDAKGSYLIEFDRGGDFGRARYTITEGLYEFTPTDRGWELYRQPDAAAAAQRVKSNPLPPVP